MFYYLSQNKLTNDMLISISKTRRDLWETDETKGGYIDKIAKMVELYFKA